MTEFNLSEKIKANGDIYDEHVKEFIRLLKEEIDLLPVTKENNIPYQREEVALILSGMKSWFRKKLNALAGEKLIK